MKLSDAARLQDPTRREHFVYRAFDAKGRLLYVGCTSRPHLRFKEHQFGSRQWIGKVARWRVAGPYTYEVAREMERHALATEFPKFGCTPQRRAQRNRRRGRWAVPA